MEKFTFYQKFLFFHVFCKILHMQACMFVMIYNILLYIVCGFVLRSWILPLYSIVTYATALKTVDFIVEGIDRSKCAIIITEHPDERHRTQH